MLKARKRWERMAAGILCACMIFTGSGISVLAQEVSAVKEDNTRKDTGTDDKGTKSGADDTQGSQEAKEPEAPNGEGNQPQEEDKNTGDQTVPPSEGSFEEEKIPEKTTIIPVVYWNAGSAQTADGQTAAAGSDEADGQSKDTPVKSLEKALEIAASLKAELNQEVTIYAMGTYQVTDKEDKAYDGQGVVITTWEERAEDNQAIFDVKSGNLKLAEITLSGKEKQNLVTVETGKLHIGKDVALTASVLLDYIAAGKENKKPEIILSEIPKDKMYTVAVNAEEKDAYSTILSAEAATGLKGDELLKYIVISEASQETWNLSLLDQKASGQPDGEEKDKLKADSSKVYFAAKAAAPEALKAAPRAASGPIYWNPTTKAITGPEDGDIQIPAGNDKNHDGSTFEYPVLTFQKAKELALKTGQPIICMTSIAIGDEEAESAGLVGNNIELDGEGVIIQQWETNPEELFVVGKDRSLTFKDIKFQAAAGYETSTIVRIIQGELNIDTGVYITGEIQTELSSLTASHAAPVKLIADTANLPADAKYSLYYSELNDNQTNQGVNAVIPTNPTAAADQNLMDHFQLSVRNTTEGWELRFQVEDGQQGEDELGSNILELHRDYKYTGVFVNGVSGKDTNFGGNCLFPVKTFAKAKEILEKNMVNPDTGKVDGVIYVCGTLTVADQQNFNFTDTADYQYSGNVRLEACQVNDSAEVDGDQLGHAQPAKKMIQIAAGGELTTKDIQIVHPFGGYSDSANVTVAGGGTYHAGSGTVITGGASGAAGTGIELDGQSGNNAALNIDGAVITKRSNGVRGNYGEVLLAGGEITANTQSGLTLSSSTFTMPGGTIRGNGTASSGGANGGGVSMTNTVMNMTGGIIDGNKAYYNGGGIHASGSSQLTIASGTISGNSTSYNYGSSPNQSYGGGGIFAANSTDVTIGSGAKIINNSSYSDGGGMSFNGRNITIQSGSEISGNMVTSSGYGGGIYTSRNITVSGGTITGNTANYSYSGYNNGGGIYVYNSKLTMTGGTVKDNTGYSGGIAVYSGSADIKNADISQNKGGGISIVSAYGNSQIKDSEINENIVNGSNGGGGVFCEMGSSYNLDIKNTRINKNKTSRSGGGIFYRGTNLTVSQNTEIKDNDAGTSAGGGIYLQGGMTVTDAEISGNKAANGGGIWHSSYYSTSEAKLDGAVIQDNTAAQKGGGIYHDGNTLTVAGTTDINTNTAPVGATMYLAAQANLLSAANIGNGTKDTDGVDDVYLDVPSTSTAKIYMDPENLNLTDSIYMNTATSKIYLLSDVTDTANALPVSVNDQAFDTGSIVVSPAGNITLNGTAYSYDNASSRSAYFSGGRLPEDQFLGGYRKNIVLVGPGVYLDGVDGDDDAHSGTSPADAVKTYEKAVERLQFYIEQAKAAGKTFKPYIYICGTVSVVDSKTWKLNETDSPWLQQEGLTEVPQVIRFGSFYDSMISVDNGGDLTFQGILINGNKGAVDGANNTIRTSALVNEGGHLTITDDAVLSSNYSYNIEAVKGTVDITGSGSGGEILNPGEYGIYARNGATVTFDENGHIRQNDTVGSSLKGGVWADGTGTTVTMKGNSFAEKTVTNGGGVIANVTSGAEFVMTDSAQIRSAGGNGIQNNSSFVTLMGNSLITKTTPGNIGYLGEKDSTLTMKGHAQITNCDKAVFVSTYYIAAANDVKINIEENASLLNNQFGIYASGNTSSGSYLSTPGRSTINIKDNAVIDGTTSNWSYSYGINDYYSGADITLTGNSVIRGCKNEGIRVYTPYKYNNVYGGSLTVSGSASVAQSSSAGILISKHSDSYMPPYQATVAGTATITGNGGRGIQTDDNVTLNLESSCQIYNNGAGISAATFGRSVYSTGKINMDGTVTVDEEIYLADKSGTRPITLNTAIPENNSFIIGYLSSYIGNAVVIPGGNITDAAAYFDKFTTANIPNGRGIQSDMPNIVVETENNVYLAGTGSGSGASGDDSNNGVSPASPVRTFKRAKEVLQTLRKGANINICNYPVTIMDGDTVWSLEDGKVSNGTDTWSPLIQRYSEYTGGLININGVAGTSRTLTIENLTIDGNKSAVSASAAAIYVQTSGVSLTMKNSAMKNHGTNSSVSGGMGSLIYLGSNSNLTMEGCTIENNTSQANAPLIRQPYNDGSITIKDTSITDNIMNTGGSTGGFAVMDAAGTVNIEDTVIEKNSIYTVSDSDTGIFRFSGTSLNIKGTTSISNNNITSSGNMGYGRGALLITNGTAALSGTVIQGNKTDQNTLWRIYGGGISILGGKVTLTGVEVDENVISGTNTECNGAGIYQNGGTLIVNGGSVSGNINKKNKGGAFNQDGGTATFNGTAINGNEALYGAGIHHSGTVNLNGAVVSNNVAAMNGGGIYTRGALNISSANIDNNTAKNNYGGGIYQDNGSTVRFGGGSINSNKANYGAAIYYSGVKLSMEGGVVNGNQTYTPGSPQGNTYSPIYVNAQNFQLKGGTSVISDKIYLANTSVPITMTGSIYQKGRLYKIELGTGFTRGSVVVKPDGAIVTNAAQYQKYFDVAAPGLVLEKEIPNLVLKQVVFIDGVKGADSNSGGTPDTAVKTFAKAKSIGGGTNLSIYVSGPILVNGAENWSLHPTSSLYRYAGFALTGTKYPAYDGPMVELSTGANLNLSDISIYGRRDLDEEKETDTMFQVKNGASLTVGNNALLSRNKATDGGAAKVEAGGIMNITGGRIDNVSAVANGGAVYLQVQGALNMSGSPVVVGDVYLDGEDADDSTSSFINVSGDYVPGDQTKLEVGIKNPYAGRHVIHHPAGYTPTSADIEKYKLETDVMAVYDLDKRNADNSILELKEKGVVYIDGVDGKDGNSGDSPKYAVKTLLKAYELLRDKNANPDGGLIIVVNTVTVDGSVKLTNEAVNGVNYAKYDDGTTQVDAGQAVAFRRYAQPVEYDNIPNHAGEFDIENFTGTLFEVADRGAFTLGNIQISGHSEDVNGLAQFKAKGVAAKAALVTVRNGGEFDTTEGTQLIYNNNTAKNGKGGAVFIDGGACDMEGSDIDNVAASRGSAVYQDGTLKLSRQPKLNGEFYLTGSGTKDDPSSSKYIEIKKLGFMPQNKSLTIKMEDAYNTRQVIKYPDGTGDQVKAEQINIYKMEQSVINLFMLNKRTADTSVLELQLRPAVYVDGQHGSDTNDGSTPDTSVATLEKAYTILKSWGGGVISIVDTVKITSNMQLTNMAYVTADKTIQIVGGETEIRRYAQPDNADQFTGYTHASNKNTLLELDAGAELYIHDITIDGHKNARTGEDLLPQLKVSGTTKAEAPLIDVKAGMLDMGANTVLQNNNNQDGSGGAVRSQGTVTFTDSVIKNNEAAKGAGVYQGGIFTFNSGTKGINGQEIYLATPNTGTEDAPVWGADSVVHIQDELEEGLKLNVNMDHAVRGRNVAVFDLLTTPVAEKIGHFTLGSTVPEKLPLIADKTELNTLELNDYTSVTVSNTWEDMDNVDNYRQAEVQAQLMYGTVPVGSPVTLNEGNNWTYTIEDVPRYDDTYSDLRQYTIQVVDLPEHYTAAYSYDYEDEKNTLDMTLSYIPMRTITYDANGADEGTAPTDSNSPYVYQSEATVLGNSGSLAKAGYQFAGWNTQADGTGTAYQSADTFEVLTSETMYAMWLKADKASEEENQDGILRPGEQINYTLTVQVPNEADQVTITDTLPDGTVYVEGSADNGGVFEDGKVTWTFDNVAAGTEYTLHFAVTVGTDQTADTEIKNQADVAFSGKTYNTTETTDTVGTTYRVQYDANTADSGTVPQDQTFYADGESAAVIDNTGSLMKLNSAFTGWNTKADGTGTHYNAGDNVAISDNVTLYAMWVTAEKTSVEEAEDNTLKPGEKLHYEIKITVPEAAQSVVITDTIPAGTVYADGSATLGGTYANGAITWNITGAEAGDEITAGFDVTVPEDAAEGTQYSNTAQIAIDGADYQTNEVTDQVGTTYRITYHANGGTGFVPVDGLFYAENEQAAVSGNIGSGTAGTELVKDGAVFVGWNTKEDGSGTHYDAGDTFEIGEDTSLYAMWLGAEKTSKEQNEDDILKPGEQITYKILITVPENADSIAVTDIIPEGTTYVEDSANENGIYDAGTKTLTWTLENKQAGDTAELKFTVTVDTDQTQGTEIQNTAEIIYRQNSYQTTTAKDTVGETFHVTYDGNGNESGTAPEDKNFYADGEGATVLDNTASARARAAQAMEVENGYFLGWNTAADGTGTHYNPGDTFAVHEDITLYAMWLTADKHSEKLSEDSELYEGKELLYKIQVKVPEASAKLKVTDKIPNGTSYVSHSANKNGVMEDGVLTWKLSNLEAGEVVTLSFKVTLNDLRAGTKIENQAAAVLGGNEYLTNVVTDTAGEKPKTDKVTVEKFSDKTLIQKGDTITYTFKVSNHTDRMSKGVFLRDYIPQYTTFAGADKEAVHAVIDGKECVSWYIESLKPGEEVKVSFRVKVNNDIPYGASVKNVGMYEPVDDKPDLNGPKDPDGRTNGVENGFTSSSVTPGRKPAAKMTAAKTGDTDYIVFYLLLLAAGGAAGAYAFRKKRRQM